MKVMLLMSSPNENGLTAACCKQAKRGCVDAGANVSYVRLNSLYIERCVACNQGWGACKTDHFCQLDDDFQSLYANLKEMDAFIFVTPVYWWDMSESMKAFVDRLRRCETTKKQNFYIAHKPVICIAAAGGSGNGVISCLTTMEKFVDHLHAIKYDLIGITQRNRIYKLPAIYEAAKLMTKSLTQ